MAKIKTIDKKDAINAKKKTDGISESDRRQAEAVIDGVNLIKQAIKVAHLRNNIAGGGGPGLLTMMTMTVGDIINGIAYAAEVSRQEAMEEFFSMVRDYVNDDSHFKGKPDIDMN